MAVSPLLGSKSVGTSFHQRHQPPPLVHPLWDHDVTPHTPYGSAAPKHDCPSPALPVPCSTPHRVHVHVNTRASLVVAKFGPSEPRTLNLNAAFRFRVFDLAFGRGSNAEPVEFSSPL
ncbi:hypothetical protein MVEN_00692700 [Mycena venus]|uniref:Uncharacterized protein n=1 Tax=Mycena venus TaxID=2733690 RepID=A0A8H7D5L8_9AGAR|nr:hypothetical protein MVEN_00692700 [Mycena venus]